MKTNTIKAIAIASILASCTPTAYVVDTTTYQDQIETTPSEVVVKPEHVQSVGGFRFEGGVAIESERGRINVSERGVSGEVVIDLRDAPTSAITGGK